MPPFASTTHVGLIQVLGPHEIPWSTVVTESADFAARVLADAKAGRELDFRAIREGIHDLAERAKSEVEHVTLLQVYTVIMDAMESGGNVEPDNLEAFRKTRDQDYHLLLTREILIGENASVELTARITDREIAAGRMLQDDPLRIAVADALTRPFLSIKDLQKIEQKRIANNPAPKSWRSWFGKK